MNSGIYCIENLINNKKYVGKAKNINLRKNYHFSRLINNKHDNNYLQKAWNKYGEDSFYFYILEKCDSEKLSDREKYWISKLKTANSNFGYNLTYGGDGASIGNKNPQFGKGLPEHLIDKGFKTGINHSKFGKKPSNSRSKYFGVNYIFQSNKVFWRVRIRINKIQKEIGYFKTEIEAALAYNDYIIENNLSNPLNIVN